MIYNIYGDRIKDRWDHEEENKPIEDQLTDMAQALYLMTRELIYLQDRFRRIEEYLIENEKKET